MPVYSCTTTGSTLTADNKLVSGWIRENHSKTEVTGLATEIAAAITRTTSVPAEPGQSPE
jgi:hypothetical protein